MQDSNFIIHSLLRNGIVSIETKRNDSAMLGLQLRCTRWDGVEVTVYVPDEVWYDPNESIVIKYILERVWK